MAIEDIQQGNSQKMFQVEKGLEVMPTDDFSLANAEQIERELEALLESTSSSSLTYQELLLVYIQEKNDQVDRLEDNLERLIEQQQSALQRSQLNKPGYLALPSTKQTWSTAHAKLLSRLNSLHDRLESVHTIANDTGLYTPKIEDLATRKLRAQEPELALEWDEWNAAQRHIELQRRHQNTNKDTQKSVLTLNLARNFS